MHTQLKNRTEKTIEAALARSANEIRRTKDGTWSFQLVNGRCLDVSAALNGDWLHLTVHNESDRNLKDGKKPPTSWRRLNDNKNLSGGTKYVLDTNGEIAMRSDVLLSTDDNFMQRVDEACLGLLHGKKKHATPSMRGDVTETDTGNQELPDIAALVAETDWTIEERSDNHWVAQLDTPGSFHQAKIAIADTIRTQLSVELGASKEISTATRSALSRFLLTLSRYITRGRATIQKEDDVTTAAFEVCFDSPPTGAELAHGLAALSIAARIAGKETPVLFDDTVAKLYLTLQGRSLQAQTESTIKRC